MAKRNDSGSNTSLTFSEPPWPTENGTVAPQAHSLTLFQSYLPYNMLPQRLNISKIFHKCQDSRENIHKIWS